MGQQQAYRVADQIRCREVAAHQQRRKVYAKFGVADRQTFGLKPGHVAEEVILRVLPTKREHLGKIVCERRSGPFQMLGLSGRPEWVETLNDPLGPVPKLAQSFMIHTENRSDDIDWDRHAEVRHQVESRLVSEAVQGDIDDALHV